MKNIFRIMLFVSLFVFMLGISAFAAEKEYIYVDYENGIDSLDSGSADRPVKTFTYALNLANKNKARDELVVVFMNSYTFVKNANEVAHDYKVTLTSFDGVTDFRESGVKVTFNKNLRYILNGTTSFENIDIVYSGTLNFTAQYNPITFGEGVTTTRTDSELSGIYVIGGYQAPDDTVDVTKDSYVTIKSGTFRHVCGGTRDKADGVNGTKYAIGTYTGTHYIDVSGGYIENLYGGSLKTHYSTNAVINMSGGEVLNFHVAGDMSRRLNGNASVTLTGGKIGTLNVNNIIGTAVINLAGTDVDSATVWCYNEEVTKLENAKNEPKALKYNANFYSSSVIEKLGAEFDKVENTAKVYASQSGSGSGESEKTPATFENAFKKAAESGSTVVLLGTVKLSEFVEPAHSEKVIISGGKLDVDNYVLNGNTEFSGVTLIGDSVFNASKGCFIASDAVKTSGKVSVIGSAKLSSGEFEKVTNAKEVIVNGAKVNSVIGDISSDIEIISGEIGILKNAETASDNFGFNMSGGKVGELVINSVAKSLSVSLTGGEVEKCSYGGNNVTGKLTVDKSSFDTNSIVAISPLFNVSTERTVFVKTGGSGNGSSENNALGSIHEAYDVLGESGGTIVICGKYTLNQALTDRTNAKKITVTSLYDGVDYRAENEACINFGYNYYCGGDTEFNNITLNSATSYPAIYANGFSLVLGDGIESGKVSGSSQYLSVMGGSRSAYIDDESDVTINSGTWQRVRGGTTVNGSKNYTAKLVINGGEYIEHVTLGSSASHDGDLVATVNGGTFYQGIYAATLSSDTDTYNGNVTLTLNGGTFYNKIAANASNKGTLTGTFKVIINGGEFAHLTDLIGTEGQNGSMTSSVKSSIDLTAKEVGTYEFVNPIRNDGADPYIFYHDGYYYYTSTRGTAALSLVRATNIGDLIHSGGTTIYTPEAGKPWSGSSWSPEIHHYTDEEIGEGNGGWYCYIGAADTTDDSLGALHRMYVLKCLDGDNLFGRWGDPVTGEVNVPRAVEAKDIPDFDNVWAAGASDIRIGGKLYMTYVSEVGRNTADFHQTINIVEMTNPWTIVGQPGVICVPEYDWEMEGYAYNPVTGHWSPKVVEGAAAVYGDDGSVFIVYTGSNYTTTGYKLGQLKYLGGNPLDKSSWEKNPTSIFSKSDKVNGTGHPSFVTDTAGKKWICYVAYLGKDANGNRYALCEPYTADKNGVVVGEGTTHPADPEKKQIASLNPMPLIEKIDKFGKVENTENRFEKVNEYKGQFTDVKDNDWFASFVKNAYEINLVKGTSDTKFTPGGTFTVAQALTAAVNVHKAYYGKNVRAALGEAWYAPYVEYCIENGIITDGQFKDMNVEITRGDMAIVFANILPDSEYAPTRNGLPKDITDSMACYKAVKKLFDAGIVGGDDKGNYNADNSIKRSEACVIFTRIAMKNLRAE